MPAGKRSQAFLLRCWQESQGETGWRFSLTQVDARREKKGFANLGSLVAYLQAVLEAPGYPAEDDFGRMRSG